MLSLHTLTIPYTLENTAQDDMSNEQRRKLHQKQLQELKQEEGLARFAGGEETGKGAEKAVFKKFECYKKETAIPNETRDLRVSWREGIFLLIMGNKGFLNQCLFFCGRLPPRCLLINGIIPYYYPFTASRYLFTFPH